ncbi:MAG: hypothetical protein GY822_29330 [Deltaproteobacteria bacterium]|nr:hypothetical protein [Deltaproteobacteria bacterium]
MLQTTDSGSCFEPPREAATRRDCLGRAAFGRSVYRRSAFRRSSIFIPLLLWTALAALACDDGEGTPDVPDAGALVDGGNAKDAGSVFDAGTLDAGVQDAGPSPLSVEQQAELLCLGYVRGEANRSLQVFEFAVRCSAEDLVPDTVTQPSLINVDVSRCLPGRAEHTLFLNALQGGRVEVDMSAFTNCMEGARDVRRQYSTLDDIEVRSTSLATHLASAACAGIFIPQQGSGQECIQAWDCQAGLTCQAEPRSSETYKCLPPASVGTSCQDNPVAGFLPLRICDDATACFDQVCTQRLEIGSFCDATTVPCERNLICGPASFCAPQGELGAACTFPDHCIGGLVCSNSLCTEPVVQESAILDGEACSLGNTCESPCSVCRPQTPGMLDTACLDRGGLGSACSAQDHCRAETFCAVEGVCSAFRGVTETCDALSPCESGLYCNSTFGLCQNLPVLGNPCEAGGPNFCGEGFCMFGTCSAGVNGDGCVTDDQCANGYICAPVQVNDDAGVRLESQCIYAPRIGAPCSLSLRCEAEAFCDESGRCRAFPVAGESCPAGVCQEGAFCVNAGTETARCERQRPAGDLCQSNGQCSSSICLDDGVCTGQAPSTNTLPESYLLFLGFAILPIFWRARRKRLSSTTSPGVL